MLLLLAQILPAQNARAVLKMLALDWQYIITANLRQSLEISLASITH